MRLIPLLLVPVAAAMTLGAGRPATQPAGHGGEPGSPTRTFTGVVTDSECDDGSHARMRMGETDAECVLACVDAHGARFVLRDNRAGPKVTYELTDQKKPAAFAGREVVVTGTLDTAGRTITVESIAAAR